MELPEIERKALLNGMEFLFVEGNPGRIPFVLMIENGAAFDPAGKWGTTQLMVSMLMESTRQLSAELIQRELVETEGELGFDVDWDAIYFYGSASPEGIGRLLGSLAEIVVRPNFTEESLEKEKAKMIAEVQTQAARVEVRTENLIWNQLFGGNPYAHSVRGTPETLKSVELRDVIFQYRRLILPNQAKLALYFPGDQDRFFQQQSRLWGGWVKVEPPPFTFRPAPALQKPRVLVMNTEDNGLFRLAHLSVERSSPDFFALKVLEQYLLLTIPDWASQISSSTQIRAGARLEARRMPGYFQVSLKADHQNLMAYFNRLREEIGKIAGGEVSADRLQEARKLVLQEYRASLQDPLGRIYRILETALYNLGINHIPTFGLRLQRVTSKSLSQVVREHLAPENFVLVVAGPANQLRADLEKVARVEVIQ